MVNIRLRRCAGCTPRKPSSGEAISRSDRARRTPHNLSFSDLGRAQNAGPTESVPLRTTWVPEPERLRPGRSMQPRACLGWFPAEQPRAWAVGREATRAVSRGWPSVACYLFAASLPPHSTTEQVSLKKKSVLHCPLCVRAEIRYWRDQQTEEAITEGTALEATGNRLKPCG